MSGRPTRGGEVTRVACRTRRSTRRSRARGRGRRPRSRAARGCPRARASPCRPTPRRARARPAASIVVVVDRPPHLLVAVVEEVVAAERGVVAADVDDRRLLGTRGTSRAQPPEITGRISTAAASSMRVSWVTSSSPTITSTDSGLSSSCWRSARPSSARAARPRGAGCAAAPSPRAGYRGAWPPTAGATGLLRARISRISKASPGSQLQAEHVRLAAGDGLEQLQRLRAGRDVEPAADAAAHPAPERRGRELPDDAGRSSRGGRCARPWPRHPRRATIIVARDIELRPSDAPDLDDRAALVAPPATEPGTRARPRGRRRRSLRRLPASAAVSVVLSVTPRISGAWPRCRRG